MKVGFKIEINQDRNLRNFVIVHYYPTIRDKGIIYYGNRQFWEQGFCKKGENLVKLVSEFLNFRYENDILEICNQYRMKDYKII